MLDWVKAALALPPQGKIRVRCCGSTRTAIASRSATSVTRHCFRCGETTRENVSLQDVIRAREAAASPAALRDPVQYSVSVQEQCSAEGLVWLGRAGITPALASLYGVKFSPARNTLLLPVFIRDVQNVSLWLEKPLDPGCKQKYRFVNQTGKERDGCIWFMPGANPTVVVTEDILSAIRVHDAGFTSMSPIGTNLSLACIGAAIAAGAGTAWVTWFDNDRAGHAATGRARNLALFGITRRTVTTPLDPKRYSREEIIQCLT